MDLETEIAAYDGRHKDVLEAIAARLPPGGGAVRDLTALARRDDAKLQAGATWLLKHFLESGQEQGVTFSAQQSGALLALLGEVSHWEARLHLLQILPALTLPEERKAALYRLLTGSDYLQASNKFVRAWTYNALAILATRFPELRKTVAPLLISAQEDEAASVRARLRRVMKENPWAIKRS
ncbi:hypothetical protein [Pelagibius sp.]|uniref:hypothetical protein n=1 Tax=Pelagibius sp. TaxID=1931238 RepID=UPI003BB0920B